MVVYYIILVGTYNKYDFYLFIIIIYIYVPIYEFELYTGDLQYTLSINIINRINDIHETFNKVLSLLRYAHDGIFFLLKSNKNDDVKTKVCVRTII